MNKVALIAGALVLATAAANASPGGGSYNQGSYQAREGYGYSFQPTNLSPRQPDHGLLGWQKKKLALWRTEALKRQQEDGGTLTASDRDYLHAKLDRILVP
ncbi:MAG TPA: hypothetical protein VNX86_13410 [Rhizomicrobium sp.]|jgi:hypothetical protein|nr:hypothetical protein [Rhizomicrobium sp.]